MSFSQSLKLYSEALHLMPGGVNSPVRAFKNVDGSPLFISHGKGSKLFDVDGNSYVDYVAGWGPSILGHAHPEVIQAIVEACSKGLCFGAPTEAESQLATIILSALPSMEQVRLVSSGTEACMAAVRLARGATGRDKILKFAGNYHGFYDALLVKAGSGVATFGLPESPGIPKAAAADTLVCEYNDLEDLEACFARHGKDLAGVILEPIVGNSGFIRPSAAFMDALVSLCKHHGALLIFDEVMTGFRVHWGGYQKKLNLTPDITVLGKVIGGGLPLAAYGARKALMEQIAPSGPIYQAGTLSGSPVPVAAGIKTLEMLSSPDIYKQLSDKSETLMKGFTTLAERYGIPLQADWEGGMFGIFFAKAPVTSFTQAKLCDHGLFKKFFHHMLNAGVYWAPSPYEAGFMSINHGQQDLAYTLEVADKFFKTCDSKFS